MVELHGVITSLLTPFNDDYGLDEETLAQELQYQLDSGVHGICILGGTGESLSLSAEERERAVEVATAVVERRVPLIAGCFLPQEKEIVAFSRKLQHIGADALMLTPPPFYKATAYQFQTLLERLSGQCSIPLIVYNAPARAGVKLKASEIGALVTSIPSIVGVKDAAGDMPDFIRIAHAAGPACALLQGLDDLFLPSLAAGASGGILALASVFPAQFVRIYDDWKAGRPTSALGRQLDLVPLMSVINREPMPVLVKEAMRVVGRPVGPTRPPLYEPSPENRRDLRGEVEAFVGTWERE